MPFIEEMNRFFNGYKPEQRARVEASTEYQKAAKSGDIARAQEIACTILEGNANTKSGTTFLRLMRDFDVDPPN